MGAKWKGLGLVLASAFLYILAFPPFNLGLLVFVALVPWLIWLRDVRGRTAFWGSYGFGFLLWTSQMSWLIPLTGKYVGNAAMGLIPLAVVGFLGSWYFALAGILIQRAWLKGWTWAIPLAWVGVEVLRSIVPHLAFPYFQLALPLWAYPMLAQGGYFGTIYLVSLWVAAINLLLVFWLVRPEGIALVARRVAIGVVVLFAGSGLRFATPVEGSRVVVTAGQPGVDLAFSTPEEEGRALYGKVAELFEEASRVRSELLVLPEGLGMAEGGYHPALPFVVPPGVPVILGAKRLELKGPKDGSAQVQRTFQSAYSFDGTWRYADKARLVIFGEYVPGRDVLPFLSAFKLPSGDLTPGERTQALQVGNLKVGPLVCFEGLFFDVAEAQVRNGAQILAAMSIDDWYMGTGAPDQLRAGTVWRAIETGLPTVRAGGLGYSMIINDRGQVMREAPLGKTAAISATVYVRDTPPEAGLRPYVPWAFLAGLPVLMVFLFRRRD